MDVLGCTHNFPPSVCRLLAQKKTECLMIVGTYGRDTDGITEIESLACHLTGLGIALYVVHNLDVTKNERIQ